MAPALYALDFIQGPEASRASINTWVAEQTEQKITGLLPERSITTATRLVLTNAVYLNAPWGQAFGRSFETTFHLTPEQAVEVPFMETSIRNANYSRTDDATLVTIPYRGDEVVMTVIVPRDLDAYEQQLTGASLFDAIDLSSRQWVIINLPKFETRAAFGLNDALKELGVVDAFDESGAADFGGITRDELWIDEVLHEAVITADETGVEAAGATAVGFGGDASASAIDVGEPIYFVANRPFVYVIWHRQTRSVLFAGRLCDPS